jgi:putative transcriptional regulator
LTISNPLHHFSEDLLRTYAVGSASDGASLAVACHLAFCPACRGNAADHEAVLDTLLRAEARPGEGAGPDARERLLASLPAQEPAPGPRPPPALPKDMPELPAALVTQLGALDRIAWRRLIPGIRAIDLSVEGAWRARLVCLRPGTPIPLHDHGGPEHTVVFSGGLDDNDGHLGRGDAATMLPGDAHKQRVSPGEPCVALIINEAPAQPLTWVGRVLKRLTGS